MMQELPRLAAPPANRSSEELRMRELIVPELRRRWPDARIVHELPLRYSTNRIDLAAITETEIISVEIKSSRDVADRLEAQLRGFLPISSNVIVALAPRWNAIAPLPRHAAAQEAIRRVGQSRVSVWTVCAEAGTVDAGYLGGPAIPPWTAQMLHVLHVVELHQICAAHRLPAGLRANHKMMVSLCNDYLKGSDARRAVCRALRARAAFGAGSDAPIAWAAS